MVQANIEKAVIYYGSLHSFYNVWEEPDLPPLGSRVIRGPDWQWGNQDTEGPGTVFNHSPNSKSLTVRRIHFTDSFHALGLHGPLCNISRPMGY